MSRPKGLPKTGGRKKGTPNRRSLCLHETLHTLDFDAPKRLIELLPELPPERQASTLLSLLEFLYPKRKAIDHKIEQEATASETAPKRPLREVVNELRGDLEVLEILADEEESEMKPNSQPA